MNRKKATALAIVVAAAAVSLVLIFYTWAATGNGQTGPPGGNGTRPPPSVPKTAINVLTSPATFPFAERWATQYNNGNNLGTVQLIYSADVDNVNIPVIYSNITQFLADYSADLAITGRPIMQTGNFTYERSVLLPVSPQAVAIVYNVPGFPDIPSGIKFNATTLHAVLSGNVTHWNDYRLAELNPDLNLSSEPIVVVHERRAGPSSDLLEQYLNSTITWPQSSLTAESADTLATVVRQTPFSVGYVDFSNAIQTRMTYAALQNSDGEYILPSSDSIGRAIQNGTIIASLGTNNDAPNTPPTISVGQLGNGSYPVVSFYYVAFGDDSSGTPTNEKAVASLDFARWISGSNGQQLLTDVQYPSIYEYNETLKELADDLATEVRHPQFGNSTNFTNNPNDSVYGQVSTSGDDVYVVWQESVRGQNYDILLRKSPDGGNTFNSITTNLSGNEGFSEHPQIAASGTNVYVVWADNTSGKKEIMFSKSANSGDAFDGAMVLSDHDSNSYNTEIAASGTNVYVVWQERNEGRDAVVFRASLDGGNTFGTPVTIAASADPEAFPKVAAYEDAVHLVWASPGQPGLHYVKSTDAGATFSPVRELSDSRNVGEAQVAAHEDNVYVIWGGLASQPVDGLFYVASTDAGATFTTPASVSSAFVKPMNVELAIAPSQNNGHSVHIVAQVESSPDNEEILLASSINGSVFTEPMNLSNNEGVSECPSIAVSDTHVFVVWEDRTVGNNEIFMARGNVR
jgi:ABC-type phosphate transport system substrate-binding protein